MLSTPDVILAGLIVVAAYVLKGFSGFGAALIMMPFFALFLDIKFAVPVGTALAFVAGTILCVSAWKHIDRKSVLVLMCGMVLGTVLGTNLLIRADPSVLKRVFGIVVAVFSINMLLSRNEIKERDVRGFWGLVAGFVGGCAGGLFNTNGPPVVIYLNYKLRNKESLRATIIAVIFLDTVFRTFLYAVNGLMKREVLQFALYLLLPLAIGLGAGMGLHLKTEEKVFRNVIAVVLLVTAVLLLL
jgi:uncharacterized membrane protein YfcA